MANGNISIDTKEDFLALEPDERQWLMFKTVDKRLSKLEKRKNFDTSLSGITGLIGGASFWVLRTILKK